MSCGACATAFTGTAHPSGPPTRGADPSPRLSLCCLAQRRHPARHKRNVVDPPQDKTNRRPSRAKQIMHAARPRLNYRLQAILSGTRKSSKSSRWARNSFSQDGGHGFLQLHCSNVLIWTSIHLWLFRLASMACVETAIFLNSSWLGSSLLPRSNN